MIGGLKGGHLLLKMKKVVYVLHSVLFDGFGYRVVRLALDVISKTVRVAIS